MAVVLSEWHRERMSRDRERAVRIFTHECDVNGFVAPNAICGKIICSSNKCGAEDGTECEHRRPIPQ